MRDSERYTGRNFIRSYFLDVRFRAVFCLRLMQVFYKTPFLGRTISLLLKNRLIIKYGVDTRPDVKIGPGLRFVHLGGIVIHGDSAIGENFTCLNNVTIGQRSRKNYKVPSIGDDVFIGAYTMVLGGVKIGDGVSIDAMTLVEKDTFIN